MHTLDTLDTLDTLVIRIYIQWIPAKYQCIFVCKIPMYACVYKNVGVCVCINVCVCVQTHILYLSVENHLENLWQPSSWYRQTNKQTNRHPNRQTNKETYRHQTNKKTPKQTSDKLYAKIQTPKYSPVNQKIKNKNHKDKNIKTKQSNL